MYNEPIVLSIEERAYLAGILDGEGFITIYQVNGGFDCRVGLCNTDEAFMRWVSIKLNACLATDRHLKHANKKWKDCYTLMLHSNRAKEFLTLVLPWLRIKKERAEIILGFPIKQRGINLTEAEELQQAICVVQLSKLNTKGPGSILIDREEEE